MAEEGLLEPLVIIEPGDVETSGSSSVAFEQSCDEEPTLKEEEAHMEDKNDDTRGATLCSEQQKTKSQAREEELGEKRAEESKNAGGGGDKSASQTHEKVPESLENDEKVARNQLQVDTDCSTSCEQPVEGTRSPEEDAKQSQRLTPDFPEALYELLCTLQEGRRLNDQRCSFRLESGVARRRCHSEPNTTKPANRVVFSSMTSLQREEFFELVATAQARRLDDQRAQMQKSPLQKSKARSIRGSIKQLSFVRKPAAEPAPAPAPKEDLYDMILTTQAQGRLEDQRSRAPGPMDDEDFFSLLLRVQGGRMEEQRTELPCILQT
eukprot:XP_011603386.1 PREDICTED: G-protein-signaling modulator 1-like [Takifugu rubripes]